MTSPSRHLTLYKNQFDVRPYSRDHVRFWLYMKISYCQKLTSTQRIGICPFNVCTTWLQHQYNVGTISDQPTG